MSEYLSFWFAKFLMDVLITVGFMSVGVLFMLFIDWKYGNKKNNKL